MSAKKYSPSKKSAPAQPAAPKPTAADTTIPEPTATSAIAAAEPSWLDSPNPRRRAIGKAVFVGLWIYVAALWLLALDQWFNWGIFGPKIPPLP